MYMKKIYFLIATVTAMMMASCTIEQDDFFSDSSANRADNAIAADVQVLTSAANGWLMQYFPDSQQSYGGYNEIIRFTADGKAQIMGEAFGDSIYTSLYSVTQSAGIVLTFDSYNPEFHAFSDPSAPIGGSEGTGWDGDFDFSILKCTAEEVVLKGKKTGNKIVMTPMPTSDWEAYLNGIWDVEDGMNAKKYGIHIGGEEIIAMRLNRTLIMDYEDNGEEYEVTASYIITPQGFKFYEPITIKGETIEGFNYVEGADVFPASNNANITLNVIYPTIAEIFVENYWFVSLSSMGEFAAPYWSAVKEQIMPSLGEQLQYFAFGAAIPSWALSQAGKQASAAIGVLPSIAVVTQVCSASATRSWATTRLHWATTQRVTRAMATGMYRMHTSTTSLFRSVAPRRLPSRYVSSRSQPTT